MNQVEKLRLGVAYHGNRILKHVDSDLRDIIDHNFNMILHTFSHNDWDRHRNVMKEIIQMSEGYGLDVWVDNWGLAGPPGDKSHFLGYSPDSHQIYSDGSMDPVRVCLNSPEFRSFTKEWIDVIKEAGAKSVYWDEPHLGAKTVDKNGKPIIYSCICKRCQELFKEQYEHDMPTEFTNEVAEFRSWTIRDYFKEVTEYSNRKSMENIICVMLEAQHGISLDTLGLIGEIDTMDNIGSDPYWQLRDDVMIEPYEYVYNATKLNLDLCKQYNKDHNIWIQGWNTPAGREEEIIYAADAAYDAGARTIFVWGYRGCESNDYGSKNPDMTWKVVGDAMLRLRNRHRDEQLSKLRKMAQMEMVTK
ncbi:hypothetical protein [Lederbergia citrea]|uniref:Uncharacterized protein n=1 Tax=Lederbergia citrea TaxID=2833581 RepID=A0A942Z692_9BACI|nr:hypothetical protein [Lederbergia citrea]MBS4224250.1 hypothetical protein [Lederbergia citrea]